MMDTFLMCAKKDGGVSHDTYSISTNTIDLDHEGGLVRAHSPFYIGKVRSNNKRRTEFGMFNSGSHDEEVAEGADQTAAPQDLGAILYIPNARGGKKKVRGPRRVLIGLPTVDENDQLTAHSASGWTGKNTMVNNFKSRDLRGLDVLMSNEGVFDDAVGLRVQLWRERQGGLRRQPPGRPRQSPPSRLLARFVGDELAIRWRRAIAAPASPSVFVMLPTLPFIGTNVFTPPLLSSHPHSWSKMTGARPRQSSSAAKALRTSTRSSSSTP